ncbi:MAG TPA: alpha/beta hydrolase [Chryseolinea sp.]|nr:alpha/beta hydrolase [Chryseolinea sp.]
MKSFNKVTCIVVFAVAGYACNKPAPDNVVHQRLRPCSTDGLDSTILCGTLSVFENPDIKTGRKIDLNIVVIPAIHQGVNKAPIFSFEGGPGVSVTAGASFYADSINYYRLEHDVVLIDVRGTGRSNPLHCRQLQYTQNLEQQLEEMYPPAAVKECFDSLSQRADLTQYTTTNMARDIDQVREWLGYDKISLFGLSFGTRLAQVYMKMYPQFVESCVLWSPTTTYSKLPLYHAQFADESFALIVKDCQSDSLCHLSFPNVALEFDDLARQGSKKPFRYKHVGADKITHEVIIPWYAFHTKLRSLMYTAAGIRQVPFLIHECDRGNWEPFIKLFPEQASFNDFIAEGLYLCVTCTEDVPFISQSEEDSLTDNTYMGHYRVAQQRQACANWAKGTVPDGYFSPVVSDIPTLIFTGNFDPVTPPSVARQIVSTLSHGKLIIIPHMSHTFDGLAKPECFDQLVVDFISHPEVELDVKCINEMLPGSYQISG